MIAKWCKTLAKRAGVEEWEKCTNHTFRMYGITLLANNCEVPLQDRMSLARHKSTKAHMLYCRSNNESEIKRIQATRQYNRDYQSFYGTDEIKENAKTATI